MTPQEKADFAEVVDDLNEENIGLRRKLNDQSNRHGAEKAGLLLEIEHLRARLVRLVPYTSHRACARNALGGGMVDCTCGLDQALLGLPATSVEPSRRAHTRRMGGNGSPRKKIPAGAVGPGDCLAPTVGPRR